MPRRILEGDVVSDKQDKTITVLVERRYRDPMYKKYVKKSAKYAAHDPANEYKQGDRVQIIECRPVSKNKRWIVLSADGQEKVKTAAPESKKAAATKTPAKADKDAKADSKKDDKKAEKKAPAKKEQAKKAEPKSAKEKTTKKKDK